MRLSNYNMSVLENSFKGLKSAGVKVRILAEKSDIDMIWSVEKDGIKKLVWIHEGVAVAGINA